MQAVITTHHKRRTKVFNIINSLGVPEILGPTCEQINVKQSLVPLESLGFVVYHTENPHSHHLGDFFYK